MKKRYLIGGSVVLSLLLFSGCGTSSEESDTTYETKNYSASGTVADGHIKNALVFVDINKNGIKDANEPSTLTDEDGKFNLKFSTESTLSEDVPVIAQGGYDILRDEPFNAKLKTPFFNNDTNNISPITTLIKSYMEKNKADFNEANNKIADILKLASYQTREDPTTNENLQTISLQLQLSSELMSELDNTDIMKIYENLAKNADSSADLKSLLENTAPNENIKTAINYLLDKVPEYVKNKNVTELVKIKDYVKEVTKEANAKGKLLSFDIIDSFIKIQEQKTLNIKDYTNYIKNYYESLSLLNTEVSPEDVKNLVSLIRDTTYEFLDPNIYETENQPDKTIAGEIYNAYNNNIDPAVKNLEENISNEIKNTDEKLNNFKTTFNADFNTTILSLEDRINEIAKGIETNDSNNDYNFTTSFGDKVIHTRDEDNSTVTEIYSINDYNLTATYTLGDDKSLTFTGNVKLEDENYSIIIDEMNLTDTKLNIHAIGEITGQNGSKITLNELTISSDVNRDYLNTPYEIYRSANNLNIKINADVTTSNNETFTGDITLNNETLSLDGKLNLNDTTIEGNITYYSTFKDTAKVITDEAFKIKDKYLSGELFKVKGNLVTSITFYNENIKEYDDGREHTADVNFTSYTGDTEHCSVKTDLNYTTAEYSREVYCDNPENIEEYSLYNKVVTLDINNTKYKLTNIENYYWYDENTTKIEIEYILDKWGNEKYLYQCNNDKLCLDSDKVYKDVVVNNINISNPISVLDIPAELKVAANVTTPNSQIKINLSALSGKDGKSYSIFADDIFANYNGNEITLDSANLNFNYNDKYEVYPFIGVYTIYDFYENGTYVKETQETNLTSVLLKGLNASIEDNQNNTLTLSNLSVSYNADTNNSEINGTIKYLDLSLAGYFKLDSNASHLTAYVDVNKTNYAPFNLGLDATYDKDTNKALVYALISNNKDVFASKFEGDEVKYYSTIYSNKGIVITVNKDSDTIEMKITDHNGNELATYDPDTGTITYPDGSSETLY